MDKVTLYEKDEQVFSQSLEPLNPHPAFPQWSPFDVYPYLFMGSARQERVKKIFRMVYIENEFLKVCIAPDIGGRVWYIYDKVSKRHAINYCRDMITYNAGFGLNYTCAGLEVNYPLAHSCTTSRKREYRAVCNADGSASVIIAEYEQIWRTRWFVKYTLKPGRSFLEQSVRIYNRGLHDSRYMYWSNCGFAVNDQTRFIFPEKAGAMHGRENIEFSWPMWKGRDLSYWKNVIEPLGLYMLDSREPYFGYYDYGAQYGFVHYADLSDLPGKKYWSWGSGFAGRVATAKTHNSGGNPYGEMQAGRIVIQEHLDRMPPETESQWTEYWYPVRNTEGFNGVGRDAAMHIEILRLENRKARIRARIIGSGVFQNVDLVLNCPGSAQVTRRISVNPVFAAELEFVMPYARGIDSGISAKLINKAGEILAATTAREVSKRDSWSEVSVLDEASKPKSAEEVFMEGEYSARDWFNHDECLKYEEALKIDPGLSLAHLELGKAKLFRAELEGSLRHLKKSLERNPDNLDAHYSVGVANILYGNTEDAVQHLDFASRYDYENRSRTRLAEIMIRRKDFYSALRYLDRITECAPRLTRPMTLKGVCLRHIGRLSEASEAVARACDIDPMDPFPRMEMMLIRKHCGKSIKKPLANLLKQIREYEPPYIEAVMDYGNIYLWKDALDMLSLLPVKGPIALFYQAFVENKVGASRWKKTLEKASRANPAGHCVWQPEMIPVLEWAAKSIRRNARIYLHLGNLFISRRQTENGLRMWKKAETLGEDCYLLYAGMGYYYARVAKDSVTALKYFCKADKIQPDEPYLYSEIFNLLTEQKKAKEARRFFERNINFVKLYPKLVNLLANQYVIDKDYVKYDDLVSEVNFKGNWQIPGPQWVWMTRYVNEGLDMMASGKYKRALELFGKSVDAPSRLGVCEIEKDKQTRILYHTGCCYEKLGDISRAREIWEKAVKIQGEYGWEPAVAYIICIERYYQAICFKKLGRINEARITLDGVELMAKDPALPQEGRKYLMELVARGLFAKEGQQDPYMKKTAEVAYTVEL
ncbi:MAG: DUF5107 domain-containing protein [Candidatus Omnitrophica bacterium]|nr:DUF5107 domain-containing protein [Candidatus Omnitrophota bacterium]